MIVRRGPAVVLSLVLSCLLLGLLTWRLEIRAQAAVVRARSREALDPAVAAVQDLVRSRIEAGAPNM